MRNLLALVLTVALWAPGCIPQRAGTGPGVVIDELIGDLSSAEFGVREAAVSRLLEIGALARPRLLALLEGQESPASAWARYILETQSPSFSVGVSLPCDGDLAISRDGLQVACQQGRDSIAIYESRTGLLQRRLTYADRAPGSPWFTWNRGTLVVALLEDIEFVDPVGGDIVHRFKHRGRPCSFVGGSDEFETVLCVREVGLVKQLCAFRTGSKRLQPLPITVGVICESTGEIVARDYLAPPGLVILQTPWTWRRGPAVKVDVPIESILSDDRGMRILCDPGRRSRLLEFGRPRGEFSVLKDVTLDPWVHMSLDGRGEWALVAHERGNAVLYDRQWKAVHGFPSPRMARKTAINGPGSTMFIAYEKEVAVFHRGLESKIKEE